MSVSQVFCRRMRQIKIGQIKLIMALDTKKKEKRDFTQNQKCKYVLLL